MRTYEQLLGARAARIATLPGAPAMPTSLTQVPPDDAVPVLVDGAGAAVIVRTWPRDAFERVVLGDRTVTLAAPALPVRSDRTRCVGFGH